MNLGGRDTSVNDQSLQTARGISADIDPRVIQSAVRKTSWRLIPFLCVLYLFAYLDRFNIGFASFT
jgi:hypothetical protein